MFRYRLYGLSVLSERAVVGLSESHPGGGKRTDVSIYLQKLPPGIDAERLANTKPFFISESRVAQGQPVLQTWCETGSGYYFFRYGYGFSFAIERNGRSIWAKWHDSVPFADVSAYLLGQVFGFALHLRGYVCLHASAVAIDGKAVLFAGDPGTGKSSTAAAFAEQGCPLLADDISAVKREESGELLVVPSFPRVCLWPDSAELLYGGSARSFPRVHPSEEKYLVRMGELSGKFRDRPAPLGAIYLLTPRSADPAAPRIEPVNDAEQLVLLLANGFESLVLDGEQKAHEFRLLGEMCRRAPVQRLTPSSDLRKLRHLCELVVNNVRAGNPAFAGH